MDFHPTFFAQFYGFYNIKFEAEQYIHTITKLQTCTPVNYLFKRQPKTQKTG